MKTSNKLLGVLAGLCMSSLAWAQTPSTITIGDGTGAIGETGIVVPVTLAVGTDNIAGIDMTVTFTTATQYSGITVNCNVQDVSGGVFPSCSVTDNAVKIQMAAIDGQAWVSGKLADITVDVDGAAVAMMDGLTGTVTSAADNGGSPISAPTIVDGTFTVSAGPAPAYTSSPAPATGLVLSAVINAPGSAMTTITNSGDVGSTLDGTCSITTDVDGVFTVSSGSPFSVDQGAAGADVVVECRSGTDGAFSGQMSCPHNGQAPGEASPAVYDLRCDVTVGPTPQFMGTPMPNPLALDVVEEGDPDATGMLTVSNSGDADGLTGTCAYAGDAQISISNGAFNALAQAATSVVGVSCDGSAEGMYAGTISCTHNGSNASPVDFPVTCDVGPAGAAIYDSTPAPGSTTDMTPDTVFVGDDAPSSDLVIRNAATDPTDRDLEDISCLYAGDTEISVVGTPATTLAPLADTSVSFSCATATAGDFTGTYTCDYDETGDDVSNGPAVYTVECSITEPASDVAEMPADGTALSANVAAGGTAEVSVNLAEILDEGADATIDSCTTDNAALIVTAPTFPYDLTSGSNVDVTVQATDQGTGPITGNLTCEWTDTDSTPGTATWPITISFRLVPVPTMSEWSRILLVLSLVAMGGFFLRRKYNLG